MNNEKRTPAEEARAKFVAWWYPWQAAPVPEEVLTSFGEAFGPVFERAQDDPELDCTPFSHPAWNRGNDAGAYGFAARVATILDGKDDGAGVLGSATLEKVRREVIALRERAERAEGGLNRVRRALLDTGELGGGENADDHRFYGEIIRQMNAERREAEMLRDEARRERDEWKAKCNR